MRHVALPFLLAIAVAAPNATVLAQTAASPAAAGSLDLFLAPAYIGRGAPAVTAATPRLNVTARSARVRGSWQVCSGENYGGTCQTLTANQPLINIVVRSARPTPADAPAATQTPAATATAAAKLDLDALDVAAGTSGQDVDFYAQPAFGTDQVSAGTNDRTAADAFCKRAGAASALNAGRGRVQVSNLIDLSTATRVRGFPLRDVLCRR